MLLLAGAAGGLLTNLRLAAADQLRLGLAAVHAFAPACSRAPPSLAPPPPAALQGDVQGPHSVEQFHKWMGFLAGAQEEEHRLAYEQFRGVAVWREGMDVRVPLTALLEAAP